MNKIENLNEQELCDYSNALSFEKDAILKRLKKIEAEQLKIDKALGKIFSTDKTPQQPKVYAYIRVSRADCTVENQREEITKYCADNQIAIDEWIEETVSGAKDIQFRKLGVLQAKLKEGDHLIIAEMSRLSRDLINAFAFMGFLIKNKINLYSLREDFALENNIQSLMFIFSCFIAAHIERDMIRERTIDGLKRTKASGTQLGRPFGAKTSPEANKLNKHKDLIKQLLDEKKSLSGIAKIVGSHRDTVSRFIKENEGFFGKINFSNVSGKVISSNRFEGKTQEINDLLAQGISVSDIAKKWGISNDVLGKHIRSHIELYPTYKIKKYEPRSRNNQNKARK